jgi:NAD(P)-dependent dehydrogenase (short-subunit alcohol dehydrogenase family)
VQRTVVITGGNAGIGRETAVGLARLGNRVVFTSRDATRGAEALADVRRRSGSDDIDVMPLDLASSASIRSFAADLLATYDRLDVLVNNAGLLTSPRSETADGFETTFGVNHLGHFLLTSLLLERLTARTGASGGTPGRVVVVASDAHKMTRGLNFDDLQSRRHYRGVTAYARSKLANIYFARALGRRLDPTVCTVHAVHPGYVDSRFGRDGDVGYESLVGLGARLFALSPEQGAATSIYCASDPAVARATGDYYAKCRPTRPSGKARDDTSGERLWQASEALVASVTS